jgi:hypothetical protein
MAWELVVSTPLSCKASSNMVWRFTVVADVPTSVGESVVRIVGAAVGPLVGVKVNNVGSLVGDGVTTAEGLVLGEIVGDAVGKVAETAWT